MQERPQILNSQYELERNLLGNIGGVKRSPLKPSILR